MFEEKSLHYNLFQIIIKKFFGVKKKEIEINGINNISECAH